MTAKQRAVDGVEPKQLLYAQHVHCVGRGSLGVLLMVSVEGRVVGINVADGGSLGESMVPMDGGALVGAAGGLQPSNA
jgi:hypothetical protein